MLVRGRRWKLEFLAIPEGHYDRAFALLRHAVVAGVDDIRIQLILGIVCPIYLPKAFAQPINGFVFARHETLHIFNNYGLRQKPLD